jgi:hypothetical protein
VVGWKDSNAAQHGTVEAPEAPKEEASVGQCGNAGETCQCVCTASAMFLAGSGWRVLLVEIVGAVHSEEGNSHGLMWSGAHKIDNCMQLNTIECN